MEIKRPVSRQPIPENAKCVFKGEIFELYQWEQKIFDGTTAIYEKVKRPDTVGVFSVLSDGKIILLKEEQPGMGAYTSTPGGHIEEGEDPLTAAKRELLEETGYEASDWQLWSATQPINRVEWAIYVFIAKNLKKVADTRLDPGERIELMPVDFDELLEIACREQITIQDITQKFFQASMDQVKKEELRKLFS